MSDRFQATSCRERNRQQSRESSRSQAGFTMIEVVVSIAIFTIVMGAIYALLEVARAGRLNTTQRTEILQNIRVALNAVGRDAINAGVGYPNRGATLPDNRLSLMGVAADEDETADFLTPVFSGNNINSVNGTMTDQVTFLYIDDTFNGGQSIPISAIDAVSESLVALTVTGGFNNNACQAGDIYIITGQNGSAIGMLTSKTGASTLNFAIDDPLAINSPGDNCVITTIQTPATIQKLIWVTYFVADEDGNGTGTGTLRRRVHGGFDAGNNTPINWSDQPLSFGVESLQVQYVLADSSVIDDPSRIQMEDIRQVRVSITIRSPEINPKTNQPYRDTLTTSFSNRNLEYEKL